ncbi:FABP family protein [Massilia endophytica]|uniref:FABP family protein n=1 Tax=Massilia endophytica TaxID=2899220 RepID=UPI001E55D67D|nr:heme-binding beta-barrel domain-containing protein [Massilia endophytica]UGQ48202.1 heme-binding beta-barrel domain-containing protein [Massilia endophytica]
MNEFSEDIYTEPSGIDIDTLANLGPLRALAGTWEGTRGLDIKPKADGPRKQAYVERIELVPIDPVTNGPQLFYGLRYVLIVNKPDNVKTYHEQVGYFLWEPATKTVIQTLAIPRGQIAMAQGTVEPDATSFELVARQESDNYGILSNPFLEYGFRTVEYRIKVSVNEDGSWAYDEDTVMLIRGKENEPFHHMDRNLLVKVAEPQLNPMARR